MRSSVVELQFQVSKLCWILLLLLIEWIDDKDENCVFFFLI